VRRRSGATRGPGSMRRAQLQAKPARHSGPARKASSSVCGETENLLQQTSSPTAPKRSWRRHFTYIRTKAGLAVPGPSGIDLFVAGSSDWKLDSRIDNRFGESRRSTKPSVIARSNPEAADPYGRGATYGLLIPQILLRNTRSCAACPPRAAAWDNAVWRAVLLHSQIERILMTTVGSDFTPATAKTIGF